MGCCSSEEDSSKQPLMFNWIVIVNALKEGDAIKQVRDLLDKNPKVINKVIFAYGIGDGTLLHWGCLWNRPQTVELLLQRGADRGAKFRSNHVDYQKCDGMTARQMAKILEWEPIIRLFEESREFGADTDTTTEDAE